MSYKGTDLDLRTPYMPGGGEDGSVHSAWLLPPEPGRDGPIPVDHTVMACCNAAYDAALFHGAREVRVEHLLYALTRVEPAREVLEQHGVRTHLLRRDAAAALAAETPAVAAANRTTRASAEFENVLRRAAGRAGQDSVPASVQDVMCAVLSYGRDAAATALFLRAASDPQQLERWAAEPRPHAAVHSALQAAFAQDVVKRLETIEAAMHTLAGEVAADRKAMLDLLGEIHHDLRMAHGESEGGHQSAVVDRIEDVGRSVTGLSERFDALRAWAAPGEGNGIAGRLAAIEGKLTEHPAAIADAVAYMLTERRESAETPLQLTADAAAAPADLGDKLASLEAVVRTQTERLEEAGKSHEQDLSEIFEALVKLGTNQQTLGTNLEAWRLDSSGDISIVSNRLENMERKLQETLSPRPVRVIKETPAPRQQAPAGGGAPNRSFKRWLYGTGRVLPSSWREDAAAIRESFRSVRRIEKS